MSDPDPLSELLERNGVAVLDGGLGTELEARGHDLGDALWSARLLRDAPEAIVEVHRDYLDAGADVVVSASYQASLDGFELAGLDRDEGRALLLRSVELAREARGARSALVAASVGPYGGALADGSEFTGVYDKDEAGLVAWHRERFELLAGAGADLLACETVPCVAEARALARLFEETVGATGWVSFCCRDGAHLSDGTPLREAAALLDVVEGVTAIGVNCTPPQHVASLVRELRAATGKPVLVYPNRGEAWDAQAKRWVGGSDGTTLEDAALEWRALGATMIGGCCRTRPADIARLRTRLAS